MWIWILLETVCRLICWLQNWLSFSVCLQSVLLSAWWGTRRLFFCCRKCEHVFSWERHWSCRLWRCEMLWCVFVFYCPMESCQGDNDEPKFCLITRSNLCKTTKNQRNLVNHLSSWLNWHWTALFCNRCWLLQKRCVSWDREFGQDRSWRKMSRCPSVCWLSSFSCVWRFLCFCGSSVEGKPAQ